MLTMTTPEAEQSTVLLQQAQRGDDHALGQLFDLYRRRLKALVRLRTSQKLKHRLDDSDILQESLLEVARRINEYLKDPQIPFYIWLRQIVIRKLIDVHRRHLGAEVRDAERDLHYLQLQPTTVAGPLAIELVGTLTSPSRAAIRVEARNQVRDTLELMNAIDREVLVLRHFEQLTNSEVAMVLDIAPSAASKRYTRAVLRLKSMLDSSSSKTRVAP